MADVEVRPVRDDEFDAFWHVMERAFGETREEAEAEREAERPWFEARRSLAVVEDGRPVATSGFYSLDVSVPGGSVPMAGLTWVSVLPQRRRRGLVSRLLDELLRGLADDDAAEPVVGLLASESSIYGRFGFGPATWEGSVDVRRGEGRLAVTPDHVGLSLDEDLAVDVRADLEIAYDAVRAQVRPGLLDRRLAGRWDTRLADPEHEREDDQTERLAAVVRRDGEPVAYALFRTTWAEDDHAVVGSVLDVHELLSADTTATAVLWQHLLERDLVGRVRGSHLPVDDPLPVLLADGRRARPRRTDGLWLRPVHVGRALAARRYACDVDVVLHVVDDRLDREDTWHLQGGRDGATCTPTTRSPHLTLGVAELGAAYLGGTSLAQLAAAGRVQLDESSALPPTTTAFGWHAAPWCGADF